MQLGVSIPLTLSEEGFERTAGILEEELGFSLIGQEKSRFRYKIKNSEAGASIVDVLCLPYTPSGYIGIGTVHHVAFRTPTDEKQKVPQEQYHQSRTECHANN